MARVLVVDDEEMVLDVIERTLQGSGHEVTRAARGDEAIERIGQASFDVAVVDYRIPVTDGLAVLAELRRRQPGCVRILVSGGLDLNVAVGAVNKGNVARVIEKPFTASQLVSAVDESVRAQRGMRSYWLGAADSTTRSRQQAFDACLEDGLLHLALQPIVHSEGGTPFGFEALLRSEHPDLGTPMALLQAAEALGRVGDLSTRVVELARGRLGDISPSAVLFVNLHPSELGEPEALEQRLEPLVPLASRVVLEITERSRVLDFERWREAMTRLYHLGFRLAVDDLGAGYSSLSILAELKPRYIKIDMSIIRGVDLNAHKRRLVELLCRFASATDALVIAEGVETAGEARVLCDSGVPLLQGFFYGRPRMHATDGVAPATELS